MQNLVQFGINSCLAGPVEAVPVFSKAGNLSTEAETMSERRRKRVFITRLFLPLSGCQPGPVECGSRNLSPEMLELAFGVGAFKSKGDFFSLVPWWFLTSVNFVLDHLTVDPTITLNNAT